MHGTYGCFYWLFVVRWILSRFIFFWRSLTLIGLDGSIVTVRRSGEVELVAHQTERLHRLELITSLEEAPSSGEIVSA